MLARVAVLALLLSAATACAETPAITVHDARVIEGDAGVSHLKFKVTATNPRGQMFANYVLRPAVPGVGEFQATQSAVVLNPTEPAFEKEWSCPGFVSGMTFFNGELYAVSQHMQRIFVFDTEGTLKRSWSVPGSPCAMAIDDLGSIYVADYQFHKVLRYTADGTLADQWATGGDSGPFAIACGADLSIGYRIERYLFIAENNRIKQCRPTGALIRQWAIGERPHGIGVSRHGSVFVATDEYPGKNARVEMYDLGTTALTTAWGAARLHGELGPPAIALDGRNHVWIADARGWGSRIIVMREDGTFVAEWGGTLHQSPKLRDPMAIAFDAEGHVFIADGADHKILRYGLRSAGVVDVPVRGDTNYEPDESIVLELTNAPHATIARGVATGTIVNDDADAGPNLVGNTSFETTVYDGWVETGLSAPMQKVPTSHNGDYATLVSMRWCCGLEPFGINDAPDVVASTAAAGQRYRFSAWIRGVQGGGTLRMRVREYNGTELIAATSSPALKMPSDWRLVEMAVPARAAGSHLDFQILDEPAGADEQFLVDDVRIQALGADVPPIIEVPEARTWDWLHQGRLTVTARDPDADPIDALEVDLSQLPGGNSARFVASPDGTSGTLTWEPGSNAERDEPYRLTFTARNAVPTEQATSIRVTSNFASNGSFEDGATGWNGNTGAQLEIVPEGRIDGSALRVHDPTGVPNFGMTDSHDWVQPLAQGQVYVATAWVRSTGTAGHCWLWVREYQDGRFVAATKSEPIALTDAWQPLDAHCYVNGTHSTLDVLVMSDATGGAFDVDDVAIVLDPYRDDQPTLDVPNAAGAAPRVHMFPNPMRVAATLRLSASTPGPLRIGVYDLAGREVRNVADEAGGTEGVERSFVIRAHDSNGPVMKPGVYFYRAESGRQITRGRFVVVE